MWTPDAFCVEPVAVTGRKPSQVLAVLLLRLPNPARCLKLIGQSGRGQAKMRTHQSAIATASGMPANPDRIGRPVDQRRVHAPALPTSPTISVLLVPSRMAAMSVHMVLLLLLSKLK